MSKPFQRVLVGICLFIVLSGPVTAEVPPPDQLSIQAARYLELLDQYRFGETWQEMSTLFQALGNQNHWQRRQKIIRSTYGSLVSRQFYRIDYRQSYSLSPDGQYVIVQFKSSYQNKAETIESVVFDCSTSSECSIREYVIR